jgi:hypothetical protein
MVTGELKENGNSRRITVPVRKDNMPSEEDDKNDDFISLRIPVKKFDEEPADRTIILRLNKQKQKI